MNDIIRIDAGPRMSQVVIYGNLAYTAGQVDASASDVATQTKNILDKLDALLERAGSNRTRIISANIWLADIALFEAMNAVWDRWIDPAHAPARATVESRLAGPQYLVEIAVIAAAGES